MLSIPITMSFNNDDDDASYNNSRDVASSNDSDGVFSYDSDSSDDVEIGEKKNNDSTKNNKMTNCRAATSNPNQYTEGLLDDELQTVMLMSEMMGGEVELGAPLPCNPKRYQTKCLSDNPETLLLEYQIMQQSNHCLLATTMDSSSFTEDDFMLAADSGFGDGCAMKNDGCGNFLILASGKVYSTIQEACVANNIPINSIIHKDFLKMKDFHKKCVENGDAVPGIARDDDASARYFSSGSRAWDCNTYAIEVVSRDGKRSYHTVDGRKYASSHDYSNLVRGSTSVDVFGTIAYEIESYVELKDTDSGVVVCRAPSITNYDCLILKCLHGALGDEVQAKVSERSLRNDPVFTGFSHNTNFETDEYFGGHTNMEIFIVHEPITSTELGLVNTPEAIASLSTYKEQVVALLEANDNVSLEIQPYEERTSILDKKKKKRWLCKAIVGGEICTKQVKRVGMCSAHKTLFDERGVSTSTPPDVSDSDSDSESDTDDEEDEENANLNSPKKARHSYY